jgi:hypothetical protein
MASPLAPKVSYAQAARCGAPARAQPAPRRVNGGAQAAPAAAAAAAACPDDLRAFRAPRQGDIIARETDDEKASLWVALSADSSNDACGAVVGGYWRPPVPVLCARIRKAHEWDQDEHARQLQLNFSKARDLFVPATLGSGGAVIVDLTDLFPFYFGAVDMRVVDQLARKDTKRAAEKLMQVVREAWKGEVCWCEFLDVPQGRYRGPVIKRHLGAVVRDASRGMFFIIPAVSNHNEAASDRKKLLEHAPMYARVSVLVESANSDLAHDTIFKGFELRSWSTFKKPTFSPLQYTPIFNQYLPAAEQERILSSIRAVLFGLQVK